MASGCSQEEVVQQIASLSKSKFIATFEQNDSRTYLEDGKYLRWSADDELSIFMGTTLNKKFRFDGETGDNSGGFEDVSTPGFVTGNNLDNPCHYAVYPYNKGTKIAETGILTINLPSEQTYAENSFGLGNNTMVAVTSSLSDMNLAFKNVCGYLKFKLYGDNVTVRSVSVQSNGGEKLSGSATVTAAYGKHPSVAMSSTESDMVTLDCGEAGVKLGSTKDDATEFWFVIPETSFSQGFTLTVTDINGKSFVKTTEKNIYVERNIIKPISAIEVNIEDEIPYVTFKSDSEYEFSMSKAVETLEYSVNGSEWHELGTKTITFGGDNGNLRLRGQNLEGTGNKSNPSTIKFSGPVLGSVIYSSGDIRTLIDYKNYDTVSTENARFCELFKGCSKLAGQVPVLPATTLADYCYYKMFEGCYGISIDSLPATTLSEGCYSYMFYNCSDLRAPSLPATSLAKNCYSYMFAECKDLSSPPLFSLPAKTLKDNCYEGMFYGCINLTTNSMPTLPAEVLAPKCYSYMFAGCKSLTTMPTLPAKTLKDYCYEGMFEGCTNLINISSLPATILAKGCYSFMFSYCENLKMSPELPATTLANNCYECMFSNCYNLTVAPSLPATTLADWCYVLMFEHCYSLTTAPKLSAKTLAEYSYGWMFYSCENLNNITMLATDISASNCLEGWVDGVASSGTFTKVSTMASLPNGINGIPTGWTVVNK